MEHRQDYIDYTKAFGIVFVILGHINFANEYIKTWIYSFHMPLFFIASGLIIIKPFSMDNVKKRFKQLMIPYIIWSLIYAELSPSVLVNVIYGSYRTICNTNGLTSLWFLPVLFISGILVQLVLKFKNELIVLLIAIVFLGISIVIPKFEFGYPWCFDVSLIAAFFVIIGTYIRRLIKYKYGYICFIFFGFVVLLVSIFIPNSNVDYVLMANNTIGNPLIFLIFSIGISSFIIGISKCIEIHQKHTIKSFSFIGKNTLAIFLVHKPIIVIFDKVFNRIPIPIFLELLITAIFVLSISCVASWIINRYTPNLLGKF